MAEQEKPLTNRQRIFVEEYVKCWNASEAARRAGYSNATAYSIGQRLLKNVEVSKEIRRAIAERAMSADEVLARLGQQARAEHNKYWEVAEFRQADEYTEIDETEEGATPRLVPARIVYQPHLNINRLIEDGMMHLVKDIEVDKHSGRVTKVSFHDAQAALALIGRHHKLFTDKAEFSGPNGGPIETDNVTLTPEERTARLDAIFDKARARRDRPAAE